MTARNTPRLVALTLGAALIGVMTGCGGGTPSTSTAASHGASTPAAHWSYSDAEGPAHWGELAPAYVACADGSAQAPIDIVHPVGVDLPDPEFHYRSGRAEIVNNGHTIEAVPADGNGVSVNGVAATLRQMHFHAPGEHRIDGARPPAEMHFVHTGADGSLTVVSVMIRKGTVDNAAWAPYIAALRTPPGAQDATTIDWPALLPAGRLTYRYEGSLTTPPCTEGVHWFLMKQPVLLSASQIAAITAAYDGNARPVQPLNGRRVDLDTTG